MGEKLDDLGDPLVGHIKTWMAGLLAESGMSKSALARAVGVDRKNITNAFDQKMGLPRGVLFYKILVELGGVSTGPAAEESIPARLDRVEAKIDGLINAWEISSRASVARGEDRDGHEAAVLEALALAKEIDPPKPEGSHGVQAR